jgi:hypothetical protein
MHGFGKKGMHGYSAPPQQASCSSFASIKEEADLWIRAGAEWLAQLGVVVCQRFGSSKNSSDSGSSGGVAILMKLKPLWKTFGKTTSPVSVRL